MRVASSCSFLDLADAGRGTWDTQVAPAAASEPFKKDLLDMSFVMRVFLFIQGVYKNENYGKNYFGERLTVWRPTKRLIFFPSF